MKTTGCANSSRPVLIILCTLLFVGIFASAAHGRARILRTRDWGATYSVDVGYPDGVCQPIGGYNHLLSHLSPLHHLRGVVVIRVSLDTAGRVTATQIIQSSHPSLSAIVRRAIGATEWKPDIAGGNGRRCITQFAVEFQPDDPTSTHNQFNNASHPR
jgi:hypothetical protein